MPSESFALVHANVNSLSMKLDTLISTMYSKNFKFDILCLTETKLSELSSQLYDVPGFNHVSVNRNSYGGGIRIYYRSHLKVTVCPELSGLFASHEALFIRVNFSGIVYLIGTFYRPPSSSAMMFNDYLEHELLTNASVIGRNVILTGDFNHNVHVNSTWTRYTRDFCSLLRDCGFQQHVQEGTHFCSWSGNINSLLDHMWTNFERDFSVEVHDKISDHLPVSISFPVARNDKSFKCVFRDFSAEKVRNFNEQKLHLLEDYRVNADGEVNEELLRFCEGLSLILDRYFPVRVKQATYKGLELPWIDRRIKQLINTKHKLFLKLKRKMITYHYFKAYCNLLSYVINIKKRTYYSKKFTRNSDSGEKLWSTINKVFGRKIRAKIHEIDPGDGDMISDDKQMAHHFNKFFTEKPHQIYNSIRSSVHDYGSLIPLNNKSFRMIPTTPDEVITVIRKLKNSGGGLAFPVRFLKLICDRAAVHVAELFNLSVRHGVYPTMLKIARIVPVYKRGDARQIHNYRPISILPPLNKVFEKIIYKQMMKFIDGERILSPNQFGFRKGCDTGQAALKLIHTVLENYSGGRSTACIFLDYSAAFDALRRETLLQKCDRYGFRGPFNDFMRSYLSDRKQFVSLSSNATGDDNELLDSVYGVPQGSCLGPLFFLLYSNDLNYLLDSIPLILFADDSSLLVSEHNHELLAARANFYLYKLQDWANYNKLALNPEKTKCLFFRAHKQQLPPIMINDQVIEMVDTFKYLGFQLDKRLVHSDHLKKLISKMKRLSYVAFKLRNTLNERAALAFYFGLVQSSLSYGIVIYGGAKNTPLMGRLVRKQRKIISELFRNFSMNLTLNEVMRKYGLMTVVDLFKYNISLTLFRVLKQDYMPFLFDKISSLALTHYHRTRNRENFRVPVPRTRSIQLNFIYQAIASWNGLPLELRQLESYNEFKRKLKNHIFNSY